METSTNRLPGKVFSSMNKCLEDFTSEYQELLQKGITMGLSDIEQKRMELITKTIISECDGKMEYICKGFGLPQDMNREDLKSEVWQLILCGDNNDPSTAKIRKWDRGENNTFKPWLGTVSYRTATSLLRAHSDIRRFIDKKTGKEAWKYCEQIPYKDSLQNEISKQSDNTLFTEHESGLESFEILAQNKPHEYPADMGDPEGIENIYWPAVEAILLKLPVKDREALIDRFFEGLTYNQSALIRGITEDAMKKRVKRALEKIIKIFHENEGDSNGLSL